LDEPTSGVDPISRKQFWEIIQNQAKSGVTILVTTHYLEEANYCSRLALIYKGKIIALNTPGELKNNFPKTVLRLKVKNLVEIIEILKDNPHFINISIWQGALQIILKEENSQNALEKILKEKQIIPMELKKTSPSLEDVFVYLVNQSDEL
ncbi:MAG: DUF4162 domain-containing protein, partial [Armatimonadetes bacterium]|nr:DUF4162 domain-containing protein [Armatimonadota bacterium]